MPLMIDSGAFSAWRARVRSKDPKPLDIDAYIEFQYTVLERFPHAVCVNLDIIDNGKASYENWLYIRAAGLRPLPVYHPRTDIVWLHRYLEETDYIGMGLTRLKGPRAKLFLDRVWEGLFIDQDTRLPVVKVHGFGLATFHLIARYPWFSLDSTTWSQAASYGMIMLPRRRHGKWDYTGAPVRVTVTEQTHVGAKNGNWRYSQMTPGEKQLFHAYLKECGFEFGTSEWVPHTGQQGVVQGGMYERVIVPGVSNNRDIRGDLNALYYAEHVRRLPWPRPFLRKHEGLGVHV